LFCDQCGFANADSAQFCTQCGRVLQQSIAMPGTGTSTAQPPVNPASQQTEGKAVASLILGILSLTIFSFIAGIPAIVLGHLSRSAIKKSMGRLKGEGMALAGLIMGYISLAAIPLVLIIAAIAIPNLLRARIAANEAAAVASVRTIAIAAIEYKTEHPDTGYPESLQAMSSGNSTLSDAQLGSGMKSGYHFYYDVQTAVTPEQSAFFVRAVPNNPNSTGTREFCAGEDGVIHFTRVPETCTMESPTLE
jgi:type IV pilus assembly protein PilA